MAVSVSPPRCAEYTPPWTRFGAACRGKSQPFMPSCAVRRVQCPTPCATVTNICGVVTSHFFNIRRPRGLRKVARRGVDFVIACANLNARGTRLGIANFLFAYSPPRSAKPGVHIFKIGLVAILSGARPVFLWVNRKSFARASTRPVRLLFPESNRCRSAWYQIGYQKRTC